MEEMLLSSADIGRNQSSSAPVSYPVLSAQFKFTWPSSPPYGVWGWARFETFGMGEAGKGRSFC